MAGSTPNLGLYLPGGGSTGTWVPDEVADVDPINQNFQKIDTYAGTVGVQTSRNQQFYGPAAAISAITGMKLGDEYQESDGGKIRWRYDGASWVVNSNGMVLLKPVLANLVNATMHADGYSVVPGTFVTFSINNIFTSAYSRYRIVYFFGTTAAATFNTRLRAAGADHSGANYGITNRFTDDSNTPVAASNNAATSFPLAVSTVTEAVGTIEFHNPAANGLKKFCLSEFQGYRTTGPATVAGNLGGWLRNVDATVFDGFTVYLSTGTFGGASTFRVYAYI
jgi:hypothetical protein